MSFNPTTRSLAPLWRRTKTVRLETECGDVVGEVSGWWRVRRLRRLLAIRGPKGRSMGLASGVFHLVDAEGQSLARLQLYRDAIRWVNGPWGSDGALRRPRSLVAWLEQRDTFEVRGGHEMADQTWLQRLWETLSWTCLLLGELLGWLFRGPPIEPMRGTLRSIGGAPLGSVTSLLARPHVVRAPMASLIKACDGAEDPYALRGALVLFADAEFAHRADEVRGLPAAFKQRLLDAVADDEAALAEARRVLGETPPD